MGYTPLYSSSQGAAVRHRERSSTADAAGARLAATSQILVDADILNRAGELEMFNIKTLDAIHLASALAAGPALRYFITYDAKLLQHAASCGLSTANPS